VQYLVDECLGLLVVTKLRDAGHDVEWVRDGAEGTPDETVLEWSVRTKRILITEDFDYGDLIFAKGHPAFGVVILQLSGFQGSWDEVASKAVERLIDSQGGFIGNLTVLGRTRIKSRALPA
jgi:predicted nuclease of predicted toxin-antitoxin system